MQGVATARIEKGGRPEKAADWGQEPGRKTLSIITINLNNVAGLRKTMVSVVSQLTDACEYLIIDGESTDGSVDLIRSYEAKLDSWVSEPNAGIYGNMNKGIQRAVGDYCLFLNSGDWLAPGMLAEAIGAAQSGEDIIYFDTYLHYSPDRIEKAVYAPLLTMRSFYRATIGHQSTFIKRTLFQRVGPYDTSLRLHADYAFWLRTIVTENVSCKHVDKFLSYYDMHGRSSRSNPHTRHEVDTALRNTLPQRVLDDYAYWYERENDLAVLVWVQQKKTLYRLLTMAFNTVQTFRKWFPKAAVH